MMSLQQPDDLNHHECSQPQFKGDMGFLNVTIIIGEMVLGTGWWEVRRGSQRRSLGLGT